VFTKTGTKCKQVAALKGGDTIFRDEFDECVAISGTMTMVGAAGDTFPQVCVFAKTGAVWQQIAELKGFGPNVAISGTTAILGAGAGIYLLLQT
jgi:hypothetical protein